MKRTRNLDLSITLNTIDDVDKYYSFTDGISFRNECFVYKFIVNYLESLVLESDRIEELKLQLSQIDKQEQFRKATCLLFILEEQKMLEELLPMYTAVLSKLELEAKNE